MTRSSKFIRGCFGVFQKAFAAKDDSYAASLNIVVFDIALDVPMAMNCINYRLNYLLLYDFDGGGDDLGSCCYGSVCATVVRCAAGNGSVCATLSCGATVLLWQRDGEGFDLAVQGSFVDVQFASCCAAIVVIAL